MTPALPAQVGAVFDSYPAHARARLLAVRALIFQTAFETGTGPLHETLKWGEPAYLTEARKTGSTIRIAWKPKNPDRINLFFNCKTSLIETFRTLYPEDFIFEGNRAMSVAIGGPLPETPLAHCIAMALSYHRDKR